MENNTITSLLTHHKTFCQLREHLQQRIIGQPILVNRLLLALLCDGHLLVEGAPGLAKTRAVKELAASIDGSFHRIQFTPDLLPADLTGTEIYRPQEGTFIFKEGPIFHHIVLADEINRAPAKVQSALLEAMAERQVTVGGVTYGLPPLFMVMATQNPIEQEGTYPLPEAQLDRFLFYVRIDYPKGPDEHKILKLNREEAFIDNSKHTAPSSLRIPQSLIFQARQDVMAMHLSSALEEYIVQIILGTRHPSMYGADLTKWLRYGASPRGTIALDRAARAHAWLAGRDYVSPDDIHTVAKDVLRHRVLLTYDAEAEGIDSDAFIKALLDRIPVP